MKMVVFGGSLVCAARGDPNGYIQVGVLSSDYSCTYNFVPAVYASLEANMNWLSEEIYDPRYRSETLGT